MQSIWRKQNKTLLIMKEIDIFTHQNVDYLTNSIKYLLWCWQPTQQTKVS